MGPGSEAGNADRAALQHKLASLIEHTAKLLPAQGPLTGFAFLNPLEGLENLPFETGLLQGSRLLGGEPYLAKEIYRDKLASGRIDLEDVRNVLQADLKETADEPISPSGTRFSVRLAMLQYPLRSAPAEELRWFIAETEALRTFSEEVPAAVRNSIVEATRNWVLSRKFDGDRDDSPGECPTDRQPGRRYLADLLRRVGVTSVDALDDQGWEGLTLQMLWRVCREGVELAGVPADPGAQCIRHRDLLMEATGEDIDLLVNPVLIRFCAAFTDQGVSTWALPDREAGLFQSFCNLYQHSASQPKRWMRPLSKELARIQQLRQTPLDSVMESLRILGVEEDQWADYIQSVVLALRGWAGIIWQMEVRQDRVPIPVPIGSLVEFVAIRLLLDRTAFAYVGQQLSLPTGFTLAGLKEMIRRRSLSHADATLEQRTFYVFQLAQVMGWNPRLLSDLTAQQWSQLFAEIESFPSLARRRIFQLAYEHRLLVQALDSIAVNNKTRRTPAPAVKFQAVFCLDAREESFRRHLEELTPAIQTFGAAGFFGVPMYFRGIADANFSAQCPVVIRPQHWVVEDMAYPFEETHQFRARSRRALGIAAHQIHLDSRTFAPGAVLSAGLGTLASIPLVMRVLFPQFTARVRRAVSSIVAAPIMTRLRLERTRPAAGPKPGEIGFTVDEMAEFGGRFLRDIGLTSGFARLVFLIGHGSACQNNPHKSTYDCGACTGNPGGSNGRVLAAMLNHPRVRILLRDTGLNVPDDTLFVGGMHNTCEDTLTFYDLDQLPKSHLDAFVAASRDFKVACDRNAHERCRRFFSASLNLTPAEALRHVKDRSEDLAQTRPEYGNASNAICLVGRRIRSQGLFLDRRSFLQSYDPTQDDVDCSILARILSAVVPVCSGINLQYYLSAVDPLGWGCGTKLPHNVTSLLGVMDGASSDLRCGLPAQSVEIHEPVRLLFVVETTPRGILSIMSRNPVVGRILGNGWAQLAVLDPESDKIQVYHNGEFHPYTPTVSQIPAAASSVEWYRGRRDHLPFAQILHAPPHSNSSGQ
ncbi:MAG: DUF2309 domain-containing protein [Planctomycetes bacterium]|nr:DUF2309 domain-containing protein [Planctomycetota bacterium]